MKAPADKLPDNQRHVAAHQLVNAEAKYKFVDNRIETTDLRKLQEITGNSPQTQGLAQLSAMMNSSPRGAEMHNLRALADNSPRQVAQRQQHSHVYGAPISLRAVSGSVSVQRVEDDETLQRDFAAESSVQLAQQPDAKPNNIGLPLDNVKMYYNSSQPAQLIEYAYAQGRVKPALQMKDGVGVNDDRGFETEENQMGADPFIDTPQASLTVQLQLNAESYTAQQHNQSSLDEVLQRVGVIQRGGSDWTEHDERKLIEKRWEKGGYACFYTTDGDSFYSEAWVGEEKNIQYAGAVQIEPKGSTLLMHTRSEKGMEGGLGIVMMSEAVKLTAQFHRDYEFVQMTPAPGAASKKVIEILSAQIGTPEIHAEAAKFQKIRKNWQKNNPVDRSGESVEEREARLQTWSPDTLAEHKLHLESLAASSETGGVQITGPAGGFLGFNEDATAEPSGHIEAISSQKDASGYGIYIPMAKFLKVAAGF